MQKLFIFTIWLLLAPLAMANEAQTTEPTPQFSIGLGIPYGLVGANAEIATSELVSVSGGLGIGFAQPAFALGAHVKVPNTSSKFVPRFSAYFSNLVAALEECDYYESSSCEREQFAGTAVGVGFIATHFQMEFLFVRSPSFEARKRELEDEGSEFDDGSNLTLSLAYRF